MRHSVVALASLFLAAACSKPAPKVSAAAAPPQPITLTLADYSIAAPASIPAGYTTFRTSNVAKDLHQANLVRLDSGKTYADLQAAMSKPDAPPPAWTVWLGGPQNSAEVTIDLTPGNYVWLCAIPDSAGVPHFMKGMSAPMTVTAPDSATAAAAAPASDIDVTMHDYQWDTSTPITAGHHVLKVTTAAGQPHEMVLVALAAGKTASDVVAWVNKPVGPPPATLVSGIAMLGEGQTNYVTADFAPGHYAFVCFIPDAKDGKSHAMHGMVKEFTVQ